MMGCRQIATTALFAQNCSSQSSSLSSSSSSSSNKPISSFLATFRNRHSGILSLNQQMLHKVAPHPPKGPPPAWVKQLRQNELQKQKQPNPLQSNLKEPLTPSHPPQLEPFWRSQSKSELLQARKQK
jgi:hypothetical protein